MKHNVVLDFDLLAPLCENMTNWKYASLLVLSSEKKRATVKLGNMYRKFGEIWT